MRYLVPVLIACVLLGAAKSSPAQVHGPAPIRDSDFRFQKRVNNWIALRQRNIVMQQRDYSCGAAALATIARYYWQDDVTEDTFMQALLEMLTAEEVRDRVENGLAISDLRRVAVKKGYFSTIGTLPWNELVKTKVPLIIPIKTREHDHFVVYRGSDLDRVYLADPIRGNIRVPIPRFLGEWQKNAILVMAKPDAQPRGIAPLLVRDGDLFLGRSNWQVIRTNPRNLRAP